MKAQTTLKNAMKNSWGEKIERFGLVMRMTEKYHTRFHELVRT